MKSKINNIVVLFIISCISNYSYAQKKYNVADATFTVKVTDPDALQHHYQFSLIKDYIHINVGAKTTTLKANKKGEYIFRLKGLADKVIVNIIAKTHAGITNYLEPGDRITMVYKKLTRPISGKDYELSFSGIGSEKYNAYKLLYATDPTNQLHQNNFTVLNKGLTDTLVRNADSAYTFKMRILNQFKDKINQQIYNKMQADLYGNAYGGVYSYLRTTFRDSVNRDMLATFYNEYENKLTLNIEEQWNSYNYLQFLENKAKARYQLQGKDKGEKFKGIYELIVSSNTGLTREKLLLFYLLNPLSAVGSEDSNAVYRDALQYIKTPAYSAYISDLSIALKKGTMAYNFKLSDEDGRARTLTEFRGKIILLDCWFTGCSNCITLAERIEKDVLPIYNDNKNVLFVTVNVDSSREKWLASIKSGIYTNTKSINLFTDGKAAEHPFIKNYNFQGFPQLLLIDQDGKIFSATIPRNGKDICATIDSALKLISNTK